MLRFEKYRYLWPPRPSNNKAIMVPAIAHFEKQGWVAQVKKEGTCSVLAVTPERTIKAMNRHEEEHKLWSPTAASTKAFLDLPGDGWYVFVAELLHSKVAGGPKDTNYLFDILVADGNYLVGKTFAERQAILSDLFPHAIDETFSHRVITPNTWVAKLHTNGFQELFRGLTAPEDEGVVIKNPNAPLEMCSRESSNNGWQVKCRRAKKRIGF